MTLSVLTVIAVLLGLGCVALSWAQVRRIERATAGDPGATARTLKKVPDGERLDELRRTSAAASWERRLADDLLEAPTVAAKIAAVNDALAEVEHTFLVGAGWPSGAIRIALFGGMLLGVTAYLATQDLPRSLVILGVLSVSALACFEAKHRAERQVNARRKGIDDLVSVTVGRLGLEAGPARPSPRGRRRGSR